MALASIRVANDGRSRGSQFFFAPAPPNGSRERGFEGLGRWSCSLHIRLAGLLQEPFKVSCQRGPNKCRQFSNKLGSRVVGFFVGAVRGTVSSWMLV